jgi:hypothetical protein
VTATEQIWFLVLHTVLHTVTVIGTYRKHVKLSLYLRMHYTKTAYGRVETEIHAFLMSALMEVSGQLHILAALPLGKVPLVPMDRSWVDPRASRDAVENRKIFCPWLKSNDNSLVVQPTA